MEYRLFRVKIISSKNILIILESAIPMTMFFHNEW